MKLPIDAIIERADADEQAWLATEVLSELARREVPAALAVVRASSSHPRVRDQILHNPEWLPEWMTKHAPAEWAAMQADRERAGRGLATADRPLSEYSIAELLESGRFPDDFRDQALGELSRRCAPNEREQLATFRSSFRSSSTP